MINLFHDLLMRIDVLVALHFAVAIGASVHIVLTKEEPRAAVGWVGVVWLSPILGTLLYYILGINRIRRSAVSLMGRDNISGLDYAAVRQLDHVGLLTEPSMRQLAHVGNLVVGLPLLEGNQITPLINGDQARMLEVSHNMVDIEHACKEEVARQRASEERKRGA
jgi:cardiolipin synthase